MPTDPHRVQDVFLAVVDEPDSAARDAALAAACGGDAELRRRVEELLHAHQQPAPLLDGPLPDLPREAVAPLPTPSHDVPPTAQFPVGRCSLDFLGPSSRPDGLGRLGHYEVLEVLGSGGFGIVLKAFDEKLQRVVAIKALSPQLAATSAARKRFVREARSAAAVRHENVVGIYAVEEQPLPYLVMEYVPGQSLQQKLDADGPLDVALMQELARQIARGLAAAHAQGLVHRDIKPANILLEAGPQPRVKLTDFGLARTVDDASLTQTGAVAGTPQFMAPEQALGQVVDQRADLFSLGSVFYTMLSGRLPFRASSTLAVMKRVIEDPPRPIREIIPEVPVWLCELVERLHAKRAADRVPTADAVVALLEKQESGVTPVVAPRQTTRRTTRRGWIAAALLLLVAAGVAVSEGTGRTQWFVAARREPPGADKEPALREPPGPNEEAVRREPPGPGIEAERREPPGAATSGVPEPGGSRRTATSAPPFAIVPFDAKQARVHQEQWADYLGTQVEFSNTLGMTFRLIPPGEFRMGSTAEQVESFRRAILDIDPTWKGDTNFDSETPQHRVRITEAFALGKYEVTVGQFRRFVTATGYKTRCEATGEATRVIGNETTPDSLANWDRVGYEQTDDCPVWNLLPEDAEAFCQWLSEREGRTYSLPTEAQWELACRAGTTSPHYWGDEPRGEHARVFRGRSGTPQEVGKLRPNPFGLYDLCGNVSEYCADWFAADYYATSPTDNPRGPEPTAKSVHTIRGGAARGSLSAATSTYRRAPGRYPTLVGFRVVQVVERAP